jgi:homoserine kinase
MEAAIEAGAWCTWLSGSGPTMAAMCAVGDADAVIAALPDDGAARALRIDHDGARIEHS